MHTRIVMIWNKKNHIYRRLPAGTFSIFLTTSIDSSSITWWMANYQKKISNLKDQGITFPNTTCFSSNHSHFAQVIKNWHPLVFGPLWKPINTHPNTASIAVISVTCSPLTACPGPCVAKWSFRQRNGPHKCSFCRCRLNSESRHLAKRGIRILRINYGQMHRLGSWSL